MGTMDELPELLTVEEAAALLRIGRGLAYQLARSYLSDGCAEGLPVIRLGRKLRVPKRQLVKLLDGEQVAAAPTNRRMPQTRRRAQRSTPSQLLLLPPEKPAR